MPFGMSFFYCRVGENPPGSAIAVSESECKSLLDFIA
jgi:hypothetical protein